jgi:alanyl-tRNA synthetase
MTSSDIRNSFLQFFKERGHVIVPSSPVIPFEDPTLLFTNAGMNQFKDVFLGTGTRSYTRVADTQKVIRVSGKHNDLEEVGRDTYHHTFFEMLGNWSFGDYYKKEAIEWAWELLTKVWGLDKKRLWATVYKDDDEAAEHWKNVTDINPSHILRFGEKDNFWEMGETGPCGPCSEIHYDWTPNATASASMINAGSPDVIEIWNLVFIQYNRDASGKLTALPAKHVDTGMGFERICAVLQKKKSNYDTDVFTPLIQRISEITRKPYGGTIQSAIHNPQSEIDIAMRVIADHVRSLTVAISDGAVPSNEGRGYVLRRILRRAARFGRNLGMHEPFIHELVATLVETMGDVFPEIKEHQAHIEKVIKGEEEGFNATLDKGLRVFEVFAMGSLHDRLRAEGYSANFVDDQTTGEELLEVLAPTEDDRLVIKNAIKEKKDYRIPADYFHWKKIGSFSLSTWTRELTDRLLETRPQLSGENAFKLYDTFGFPLDLTELMSNEKGILVDSKRFAELMEKQRELSQQRSKTKWMMGPTIAYWVESGDEELKKFAQKLEKSDFNYDEFRTRTRIEFDNLIYKVDDGEKSRYTRGVILESTTFFAESGGQVSDTGQIVFELISKEFRPKRVLDVQKRHGRTVHIIDLDPLISSDKDILDHHLWIYTMIEESRRISIMRNHTATHLVHAALRKTLGTHVHQSGSLVAPDHLRFDFAHFSKVSDEELAEIEALVNEKIKEDIKLIHHRNIPFDEAKKMGALMFFGDKYGDRVNVVDFGEFSKEFCGGTHVKSTGEIGYFKFRHEGSVASGVRRIEAVTADYALELLKLHDKSLFDRLEYAYQQLDEISKFQQELNNLSSGKSALAKDSLTDIEQKLESFKKKTEIPASYSSSLRRHFDERSLRSRQLEDVILLIADRKKALEKELGIHRLKSLSSNIDELLQSAVSVDGLKIVTARVAATSMDELKSLGDTLRSKLGSGVGLLASVLDEKVSLVCVVTDDLVASKRLDAGKVVGAVAKLVGGGGGGRPHMATAGGKNAAKLDDALKETVSIVKTLLK